MLVGIAIFAQGAELPVPSRPVLPRVVTRQVLRPGQTFEVEPALPPGWRIVRATPDQGHELACLHLATMPEDLLPSLGLSLLANHFWPRLLVSPYGDVWALRDGDNHLAGFCVMARQRMPLRLRFYGDATFCLAMLARLLCRPRVLMHSLAVLVAPLRLQRSLDQVPAELVLLAVREDCRGAGWGRMLLQHALRELGPVACLVKTASEDARRFYQRAGFTCWGREIRDTRSLHLLVRRWSAVSPSPGC